jgi:hypothetical protein
VVRQWLAEIEETAGFFFVAVDFFVSMLTTAYNHPSGFLINREFPPAPNIRKPP